MSCLELTYLWYKTFQLMFIFSEQSQQTFATNSCVKMKNKLAIFDVDFTIKEHHGDGSKEGVFRSPLGFAKLFPNEKLPEEFFTILKEKGYHSFILAVVTALNKFGKTKNDIIDALAKDGHLVKGMDKVFKLLVKDHDIIIISGGYDEMVKRFLSRYFLRET